MEQMSRSMAWFRGARRTRSTRLVMAGAVVGGFALLLLSTFTSWPVPGGAAAGHGEDAAAVAAAYQATAGDCLAWSRSDGSDMAKVDCAAPHLFEVSARVDIGAKYPGGAAFPDGTTWRKVFQDTCTDPTGKYLGGKLDPFGKFAVAALKPSLDRWQQGDRTLRCGLQVVGPSGTLFPFSGPVSGQDQSDVHEPGTCLGIQGKSVSDPVDCAEPHSWEIVGTVDLGKQFKDFPPTDQQDGYLSDQCGKIAADYTGGADLGSKGLGVAWDNRAPESWAAGSHLVDCKVGSMLKDGSGLQEVRGSVRNPNAPKPTQTPTKAGGITPVKPQAEPTGAPMHSDPSGSSSASAPASSSGAAPSSSESASAPPSSGHR